MVVRLLKKDYINKSLEELIIERQKLMKNIISLENEGFIYKTSNEITSPSIDTIWRVKNEDFKMLTDLIENAFEIQRINEWMSEEQRKLLYKIVPNYEHMDICDIEDALSNELQTKGLEDDSTNEYGREIEKLIDIVVAG
ncbi:MAG: hypothetical protein IJK66_05140 [Bacilli bacterium]|nr:hypothetical protein [Bacilli bacterium]